MPRCDHRTEILRIFDAGDSPLNSKIRQKDKYVATTTSKCDDRREIAQYWNSSSKIARVPEQKSSDW